MIVGFPRNGNLGQGGLVAGEPLSEPCPRIQIHILLIGLVFREYYFVMYRLWLSRYRHPNERESVNMISEVFKCTHPLRIHFLIPSRRLCKTIIIKSVLEMLILQFL